MIGEHLRTARQAQRLSLTDVAERAGMSAATLSRIETNKQSLDIGTFLSLARILKRDPNELLGDFRAKEKEDAALATRITSLEATERARLWREMIAARKNQRTPRRGSGPSVDEQIEELVAQVDFLRDQIEMMRRRLRTRKA